MAGKISELPLVASPAGASLIEIVESGTNSRAALSTLPVSTPQAAAIATKQSAIDFDGRKVLFVAKGDAATDTRTGLSAYDTTQPFATIQAAITAASSGETIHVLSGTYSGAVTLKDGVDIVCDPGVVITRSYTADGSSEYLVSDNGAAVNCRILGRPDLLSPDTAPYSKSAVSLTGASTVTIEFGKSTVGNCPGMANFKINNVAATLYLDGQEMVNAAYDGIWHAEGRVVARVAYADCEDNILEISTNTSATKNYYWIGYGDHTSSTESYAILAGGGGVGFEAVIEGTFVGNGFLSEVANGSGKFILRNCRIDASASASSQPVNMMFADIITLELENSKLLSHASADYSIIDNGTVYLRGVAMNKPVGPGVTIVGDYELSGGSIFSGDVRVSTATAGTIGGAGQGGGYSYTPALTTSGGAIITSANGETLIKNTISGLVHSSATLCRNNVLAIQNTGTTNDGRPLPSAIRFVDPTGGERGAIGWSHDTVWAPFARTFFISASQPYTEGYTPAAPPRFRLLQEGTYLGVERFAGRLEFDTDWTTRFLTPLEAAILTLTPAGAATFANTLLVSGILSAGTTPTTLTDAAGKILSAALNTVAVAQGGLGITTTPANGALPIGNGTGYTSATITGTANQVTVTNGAGTITLSTPQSIATSSSPSFAGLSVIQAAAMASMTITGQNAGTNLNTNADSGAQLTLRNSSTGANVFSRLAFQDAGFSNVAAIHGVSVNDTTNEGSLAFSTRPSGGSLTTVLTLAGSGAATFISDVEVSDNTKGVILKSPNGTRWRLTVSDAGVLGATSL
jgi:hypothetical protein